MTLICRAYQWTGLHITHLPQYLLLSCVFVCVCVCVCLCVRVFPSTIKTSPD